MPLSKIDSDSLNTPITAADLAYTGTLTGSTGIVNIGSGQVYKDASGNVGIGTASPAQKLSVNGADGSNNVALFTRSGGSNMYLYVDSGANVGFFTGSNAAGSGVYANATSNTVQFNTNGSERARINSSGNLLVGTTSGSGRLKVLGVPDDWAISAFSTVFNGNYYFVDFRTSASVQCGSITSTTGNTVSYTTSSDYRLKEAIAPMTGALAKVALLKPCTYKWKRDGSDGQGFIAHELQEVVEGCVVGEKDAVREEQYEVTPAVKDEEGNTVTEAVMGTRTVPQYQGIDTSFLVATLTAALQELKAIVDAQGAEIAALKGTP
jgi:hypothetical protein